MKRLFNSWLLITAFFLFGGISAYAQNVSISQLTGGVVASPLTGGTTDQAIFGIQFDKAGGGQNEVTGVTISLTSDPNGKFTNARLVRSDNGNSYDAADLANPVGTVSMGASSITFTGSITPFGNNSGATTRFFFLVVDITTSVSSATPTITPSLVHTNVTVANNSVNANTITGTTYSFADVTAPTATFNPLNAATNVAVASNLTITFNEAVRKTDNSAITPADLLTLVELKLTNDGGAAVPFTAAIDGTNTVVTIDPTSDLSSNTLYYLEMNAVEDFSNNTFSAANITFTSADIVAPTPTFSPLNAATSVSETGNITITFDEAVRKLDDGAITPGDLLTLVELKLTDNSGASHPFTASIGGGNTIITIDPTGPLASNTVYYVEINPVEDASNNATMAANITFTTGDTQPPSPVFNPANSATDVPINTNLTITFNEAIRKIDDSAVTPADLLTLVELKLTNDGGASVPFTASIDGTNTIITIDPSADFASAQLYYLEINPVEDVNNNATTATSITFTSADFEAPTITFNPLNNAVGVSETGNLTITFNEPVRKLDNSAITPADILTLVELKLTNDAGAPITFTGSINGANTVITIDPTATLLSSTQFYLEINPIEDASNNTTVASNITFTTGDSQPPVPTFNPANTQTNVSVLGNLTITFNEPIRKTDDTPITAVDLNTLIELKLTNNAGAAVPFSASIDGTNTIITIDPGTTLTGNQVYFLEFNTVEDASNNGATANITFTTEPPPSFAGSPFSTTSTCAGDEITITGNNFGSVTEPTVTINGTSTTPADIVSFNNTSITFTALAGMAGSGLNVTVTNNTNTLSSTSSSTLTINPAINTALTIDPATTNPAQNDNVDIDVYTTQTSSYKYRLVLTSAPVAYGVTPPATVDGPTDGNSGVITFNTGTLDETGDYVYKVTIQRTGCTTGETGTFTITVAELTVDAGADKTICAGDTVTLGGNPTVSGGTAYYQIKWNTVPPTTEFSTASNPKVVPSGTTTYRVSVKDSPSATPVTEDIIITVNPKPTASYISSDSIKTVFSDQDSLYRISDKVKINPAGGTKHFSGLGVSEHTGNEFYFNPKATGTVTNEPIIFTYTAPNGCTNSDTILVNVFPANAVIGLDDYYCSNAPLSGSLSHNPTYIPSNGPTWSYTYSRLGFYHERFGFINDSTNVNYPLTREAGGTYRFDPVKVQAGWGPGRVAILVYVKYDYNTADPTNPIYEDFYGYQFTEVIQIGKQPEILPIAEGQNVCKDVTPIQLSSSISAYTTDNFTITPDAASIQFITGNYYFNPSVATFTPGQLQKNYTITYNYHDDNIFPSGGCPNSVTRNFVLINKVEPPVAADVKYCQYFTGPRILSATSNIGSRDFFWYENASLSDPTPGQGQVFDTKISTANPTTKTYYVTQAYKGCQGFSESVDIEITPAPQINLSIGPQCENREAIFSGPGGANITSWEWTFGDKDTTIYTTQNVAHTYAEQGIYTLRLRVVSNTNGQQCEASASAPITVGQNPKPNFTFLQVCDGDVTQFTGTSNIPVVKYEWIFDDGDTLLAGNSGAAVVAPNNNGGRTSGTYKNPNHQFAGPRAGGYNVKVISFTTLGCNDTTSRLLNILPYQTYNATTPYDMSALDGGRGFWTIEDRNGNSTWVFDTPNKTIIKSTSQAWVTGTTGTYLSSDLSYVNSPCLDLTGFSKPAITLNYISNTQKDFDGAALEFSTDGGVTWNSLGGLASGLSWFNQDGYNGPVAANIDKGWSGNLWNVSLNDTLWLEGRRAIDDQIPIAQRGKVRLRVVFGSSADGEFEGFAFNNVKIEERNRTMLVENFTNESAANYTNNNTIFKSLSSTEVVKVQYHLPYPGEDLINGQNQADPNARAAFYGISNDAQLVPRAFVDGVSQGSFINNWFVNFAALRSLKATPYEIGAINTVASTEPDELIVTANITALQNIPAGNHKVHVAVVEKSVGNNEFVLRKLLPSATGTVLPLPMAKDDVLSIGPLTWKITNTQIDPTDLAIIVFVQDELTKEVMQAEILSTPANLPTVVTSIEDPAYADKIHVFPSPADDEVNIVLPEPLRHASVLKLIDTFGKTVSEDIMKKGSRSKTIATRELTAGMYLIHLETEKGVVRKKVMVIHKH